MLCSPAPVACIAPSEALPGTTVRGCETEGVEGRARLCPTEGAHVGAARLGRTVVFLTGPAADLWCGGWTLGSGAVVPCAGLLTGMRSSLMRSTRTRPSPVPQFSQKLAMALQDNVNMFLSNGLRTA